MLHKSILDVSKMQRFSVLSDFSCACKLAWHVDKRCLQNYLTHRRKGSTNLLDTSMKSIWVRWFLKSTEFCSRLIFMLHAKFHDASKRLPLSILVDFSCTFKLAWRAEKGLSGGGLSSLLLFVLSDFLGMVNTNLCVCPKSQHTIFDLLLPIGTLIKHVTFETYIHVTFNITYPIDFDFGGWSCKKCNRDKNFSKTLWSPVLVSILKLQQYSLLAEIHCSST